jgi:chromosome segregation ATPase
VQDALASGRAYNSMAVGELKDELAYHAHAHDMLLEDHSALRRKYNAAKKQLADRKSTYEALQVDCSSLRQRLATTDDELRQQKSKYQTFHVKYDKAGQDFFASQKLCDNKVRQLEEKVDEERRGALVKEG